MSRILTGIQSTGTPHLGNILGAIIPAIEMANGSQNESYLFIADMHSVTQIKNPKEYISPAAGFGDVLPGAVAGAAIALAL